MSKKTILHKSISILMLGLLTAVITISYISSHTLCGTNASLVYAASVNEIYCSPEGTESGKGTKRSPLSVQAAIHKAMPGDTIVLEDGTYSFNIQLNINPENSGSSENRISMVALNPGSVSFDFSSEVYHETGSNDRGLYLGADYWYVYGISFCGSADNGIYISGSHNTIELCTMSQNKDTGLQISCSSNADKPHWPSYNSIINCTSYDNMDPAGENADGFAAKLTCGEGNLFDGCIAYNNVDDGWDLYTRTDTGAIGSVTIINCIAFRNGQTSTNQTTTNSDGNGFKIGGSAIPVNHILINCIAFENKSHGFTDNSNPGIITLINCTAYNNNVSQNGKANFDFARSYSSNNFFENLLSYSTNNASSDNYRGTAINCIFNGGNGVLYRIGSAKVVDTKTVLSETYIGDISTDTLTSDDFASIIAPDSSSNIHSLWRNSEGIVDTHGFLELRRTSPYISMGTGSRPIGSTLGCSLRMNAEACKQASELLSFPEKITTEKLTANILVEEDDSSSLSPLSENAVLFISVVVFLIIIAITITYITIHRKSHRK